MSTIDRRSHPLVRRIRALHAAKGRTASGLYLIEGVKVVTDALAASVPLTDAVVSTRLERDPLGSRCRALLTAAGIHVQVATDAIVAYAATTVTPQGVVAVARCEPASLPTVLNPVAQLTVVIAVGIQDPGNLGALIRTAEAFAASAVVACGDGVDPWSPKAVRAASGSLFRVAVARASDANHVVTIARDAGYQIVASVARDGDSPALLTTPAPIALLLGNEGQGLADELVAAADARITIPLKPPVESLNVAAAAAVLLFTRLKRYGRS